MSLVQTQRTQQTVSQTKKTPIEETRGEVFWCYVVLRDKLSVSQCCNKIFFNELGPFGVSSSTHAFQFVKKINSLLSHVTSKVVPS